MGVSGSTADLGGTGVAELHGAGAENGGWRLRVAEKEANVASMMSASTAGLAGRHVEFGRRTSPASTVDSEFGRAYSTASSRLSDFQQGFPVFEKSAGADADHSEMESRRRRIAERRARLRERYGKTPSEHGLGFCGTDCIACKTASESFGQTAAASTSQMNSRPAVTEADLMHSKSESTADSAKPAPTADFDSERSYRTPASPLFDLERFASVPGFRDFKKSAGADADHGGMESRRRRIAERRARLRERYGKTPSEHGLGFCSSDCIACKTASESLGQPTAASTTKLTFRPAVTEAGVDRSIPESTADSAMPACERSYRTPASPLFDLERLASSVYV
jgi:hypothetical protein